MPEPRPDAALGPPDASVIPPFAGTWESSKDVLGHISSGFRTCSWVWSREIKSSGACHRFC